MSNPYEVYRKQRAAAWTRVDMIIALFDEALARLDEALSASSRGNHIESKQRCLRVMQVVACLRSGVDTTAGPLSTDILRLYDFVDRRVISGQGTDLQDARRVLVTVRDSFGDVRSAAARLEAEGAIPELSADPDIGSVA